MVYRQSINIMLFSWDPGKSRRSRHSDCCQSWVSGYGSRWQWHSDC